MKSKLKNSKTIGIIKVVLIHNFPSAS